MAIYPELDEAFTTARTAMEGAVEAEISSRMQGFNFRFDVNSGRAVTILAHNEDDDEMHIDFEKLVADVIDGMGDLLPGDEDMVHDARAVSKALREAADRIEAETGKYP